ncbi:SDR family oxidoreductase [Nocardia sp. NPDC058499]|uniref:SDR family oxidoreductase n=1 Tax=Nocardia sp. NPDC058499 TaxID=3346530 RepID=UPI00364AF898
MRVSASRVLADIAYRHRRVPPGPDSSSAVSAHFRRGSTVPHAAAAKRTSPEEIAALVVFLASGRASNISGTEPVIDGGMLKTI